MGLGAGRSVTTAERADRHPSEHPDRQDSGHMSFSYELATTGAVSFTAFIAPPPARLNASLAEAGAQRGRLRDILKRVKRADDKDILAVIKVHMVSYDLLLTCLDH